jgi:NACHT domain
VQQLVQRQSVVSDDITAIYGKHIRKQRRPSLAEYSELLQSEVRRFSEVFIVIDALDECPEREGIRGFIPEVRKLLPNAHLLVTSRHNPAIEHEFKKAARLEIRATDKDIKSYVDGRIREQPEFIREDSTLRSAILDTIIQKADGMYAATRALFQCDN